MKTNHPELDKLSRVSGDSNKIGEFLEWMQSQGVKFAKYHIHDYGDEHDGECQPIHGNEEEDREFNGCGLITGDLVEVPMTIEENLAEYYAIDLKKVEEEKLAILKEIRGKEG